MFRFSLIVTACVAFALPIQANECDALLSSLLANLPRLEFAGRSRMAGAPDFDIVYLRHSQAHQVVLSCGPRQPSLNIDWRGGLPSAGYFQLIGQLGSIMTGVSAGVVRAGAMECQKSALAAKYEMSEFTSNGVKFECAIFTHDGGGTAMTIYQPKH
jgi:hypothetical protein